MKSKFIKGLLFTFMVMTSAMFTSCGYEGDAESEYNRKIAASLSPLIVQQMMLDKWDGKLPVYGTMPTLFKDIAGK